MYWLWFTAEKTVNRVEERKTNIQIGQKRRKKETRGKEKNRNKAQNKDKAWEKESVRSADKDRLHVLLCISGRFVCRLRDSLNFHTQNYTDKVLILRKISVKNELFSWYRNIYSKQWRTNLVETQFQKWLKVKLIFILFSVSKY